ncbi:MAG TPA: ATP-binding cassette domain-containing protein [Candidatus Limnocylindrales bacterium]|nr:ATP-binding cassette domain-containing protein [Candidatus Limnocylindrales bacterium]
MPGTPIIEFDDVSFTYAETETPAIDHVSLTIYEGEYVALMGRNGAGKTTLELCINGIVPNMVIGDMEGAITVEGVSPIDTPVREMAKTVGMVFDNPEFQMSQMTAAEEIALGLENLGVPYEEMKPRITDALALVGLTGFEDRMPLALSGGQQQRLAIASTLAMQPRILVMDEPTSNLDPLGKQEVFEIAARLNREAGMTVVLAEHEVEVLAEFAHRVIVLDGGRIVANGTPEEVFDDVERLGAIGLRPPAATALADRLRASRAGWSGTLPVTTAGAVAALQPRLAAGVR